MRWEAATKSSAMARIERTRAAEVVGAVRMSYNSSHRKRSSWHTPPPPPPAVADSDTDTDPDPDVGSSAKAWAKAVASAKILSSRDTTGTSIGA
jgi:hypothetical protein